MSYKQLLQKGKKIFNFHPNENFESLEQLLALAEKQIKEPYLYHTGASLLANDMAKFLDQNVKSKKIDS